MKIIMINRRGKFRIFFCAQFAYYKIEVNILLHQMAAKSVVIRDYATQIPGALSEDRQSWVFDTVNSVNARGAPIAWTIYVKVKKTPAIDADTSAAPYAPILPEYFADQSITLIHAYIWVNSSVNGGVTKKSAPIIIKKGKNLGKTNATNPFCQALRDALGTHNKQLEKSSAAKRAELFFPPMLAQIFSQQEWTATDEMVEKEAPLFVQRKYNGVRAVAMLKASDAPRAIQKVGEPMPLVPGDVYLYSRTCKPYPGFDYIKAELCMVLSAGLYLDGELYKHGGNLQDIAGMARRKSDMADQDSGIYFQVYDCFTPASPDMNYIDRRALLDRTLALRDLKYIRNTETFEVGHLAEITALYKRFLAEKYEGAMVRLNAPYRYSYNSYHSKVLLKMKETLDAEFRIIGVFAPDKGKTAGALMFVCATKEGAQFNVTPAMPIEARIALFAKMNQVEDNGATHFHNHWKDKMLIVEFGEWTKDKLPAQGRTKGELRVWE